MQMRGVLSFPCSIDGENAKSVLGDEITSADLMAQGALVKQFGGESVRRR
jgi:hypothetical protein